MKKLLLLFGLIFSLTTSIFPQTTERVTINNGVLSLKGKGKIGLVKDQYQFYQYNTNVTGNYYLQAYFKSLTNKASSYTGLAFRNLGTKTASDGGVPFLAVIVQNDTLKVIKKVAYNDIPIVVYSNGSLKIPIHLRIEKSNNNFVAYSSNEAEGVTSVTFNQLISIQDAFTGWSNVTQNFITGGNTNTVQTALASKRGFGLFTPPINNGGGTGLTTFTNVLKNAPPVTINGKYYPDLFPKITVTKSIDPVLNNNYPNWMIMWKVEGSNFTSSNINKKTPDIGIPFMFDIKTQAYGGYGERCKDYVMEQNPNNGQVWQSDEACLGSQFNQYFNNSVHTIDNFTSRIPFDERAGGGLGAGLDRIDEWAGISNLNYFYDFGTNVKSSHFGRKDWVNGKANMGIADVDNEATTDPAKSVSIYLGMADNSTGFVFDQYGHIMETVYIDPGKYPNDFNNPNSTYPQYTQRLDGTNGSPNSQDGNLNANNVPTYQYWNLGYKVSIPNRFTGQRGIADVPNALPCTEVSCISSATFYNGETYVYDTIGNTRVVNKFGMNANTQHMIARTIFAGEVHKWYCVNKLNNKRMLLQAKILCDQQQNGLLLSTDYTNTYITNTTLANKHFNREHSFGIGAMVAFTGCEWNIWDRNNADVNLDGYHGAFGLINLLNQKKTFGNTSKSFVDLKPSAKFLLWTSEISYDNGVTWLQEKAQKYVMNSTSIPQRQIITNDGYWSGILLRPENTEATSCKLRITWNGQTYYYTVTANDWETVDYNNRNTALSALPNANKDYHYFLIKLGTQSVDNTTVNPPTITSVPSSPVGGNNVNFTASGCTGTVKWFLSDGQVGTGSNYSITNAVANNSYSATCTVNSIASILSNSILIGVPPPVNTGVTITEPNKPQFFFSNNQPASFYSNRANLPAIFTNTATFDALNDVVYLENQYLKIGLNLKRGGQICYASVAGSTDNKVYNGYDGGFQWQLDATQNLVGGTIQGQTSGSPQNNVNYNTTMGGDYLNHSQSLIDYHTIPNGYYIKFRPLLYPFNSIISETEIEATYTFVGKSLKVDYTYTSFRTDPTVESNSTSIQGFAIPILFITNDLTNYSAYTGSQPWTNGALTEGVIPNVTGGANLPFGVDAKEFWAVTYNPNNNFAVGAMNIAEGGYVRWEQLNKYQGNPAGTVFSGAYTTLSLLANVVTRDGRSFQKSFSSFITLGNKSAVIEELRTRAGH